MMSEVDVRGLLQYVPQFRGKVFVIVIDVPQSALAETMLDLVSLQNIGVQLVIASTVHPLDDLLDRAAEVELKYCQSPFYPAKQMSLTDQVDEISAALDRGQAVVIDCFGDVSLSSFQADLASVLKVSKVLLLHQEGDKALRQGAIRATDVGRDGLSQPILQRAAGVCAQGVPRVHLLNGSHPAVLLNELFSNEGVGTMVYADSYSVIRPIREDDIVELLGMIGRSVRSSRLVPRVYADIEQNLDDYSVMDIDGNVVGCVALLRYLEFNAGEVACLYVKQAHEGMGYGAALVAHVEQQAEELELEMIFSLTNRAARFFQDRMGYRELRMLDIPPPRYRQLIESGRDSRVFGKKLEIVF